MKEHIRWDNSKNNELALKRGVSFEQVNEIIINKKYIDIIENPARKGQYCFVVMINKYIHIVPFVLDNGSIFLKTIYPSRKFHKKYGGNV